MKQDGCLKKQDNTNAGSVDVSSLRRTINFIRHIKAFLWHSAGLLTWETKSYEIWLVMQNLLYLLRPKTLLEFGSGRSTNYLAEYALKFGSKFISIEEHLYYCFKVNLTLKFSFLPSGIVKYAPIKNGWYSTKKLKKILPVLGPVEFLLVDGPTSVGYGQRGSSVFYEYVFPLLDKAKIIIIDDVHRSDCDEMARTLSQKLNLRRYDIKYSQKSMLAILLDIESYQEVEKLPLPLRKLLIMKT